VFPTELAGAGTGRILRTGDLGFVRDDELYVTGRLKDLIIIRGRNHSPEDIERTVDRCNPALRPGCGAAFSIDGETSERLVIVQEVAKDHQRGLDDGLLLGDVRAAVASTHDVQVHALCLIAPGTIPKTSSGKIQRRACRRMYLDGTLPLISRAGASDGKG
jgi:acyl-CoA synthetase (AMP-forming)/AMP-acid ligase II